MSHTDTEAQASANPTVEVEPAFDLVEEDDGSMTLFLSAREGVPTHATLQVLVSRPEAILWRGPELAVVLTAMQPEAVKALRQLSDIRVVEMGETEQHCAYLANALIQD